MHRKPPKPESIALNVESIPAELKSYDNIWCIWRYELKRNKNGKRDWTKMPYIADGSGRRAKTNKPETWKSFADAVEHLSEGDGIGMRFVEPYCGLDMDLCLVPDTGVIAFWAEERMQFFRSYSEISPSNTGAHTIMKLTSPLPGGPRKRGGKKLGWELALYDQTSPRYFAMTGKPFAGYENIRTVDPADFYEEFKSGRWDPTPSNGNVNGNGQAKKSNLDKWTKLKRGEWQGLYSSQSEADLALTGYYAAQFNGDHVLIDQAFRASGLMRDKWDSPRGSSTYGNMTISKALEDAGAGESTGTANSNGATSKQRAKTKRQIELILKRGDQVEEKALRWMWEPYFPFGKLIHFSGDSSQAKSPVTVDIAARVSTGAPWPDGTLNDHGPRSVIMLNTEDDLQDTILPRFRLAGGDKTKFYYIEGARVPSGESDWMERGIILEEDISRIQQLASRIPDLALIVIDPITNYMEGKRIGDDLDARSILMPLRRLAGELDALIITVGHLNRREKGTSPMHRIMGAAAFHAVPRAVYSFSPDPDEESKYCHIMSTVRSCGGDGPSLRYKTELITECLPDSYTTKIIRVVWTGKSDVTAEDAVDPVSSSDKAQETEAAAILKDILRDGRKSAEECTKMLKAEGYDLETKLNAFRIRKKAGAQSKRFPPDTFYSWYLPVKGAN